MIYLCFVLLCAVVLLPVIIGIRHIPPIRERRTSAIAFHKRQLLELDQDRETALLSGTAYDQALLEVQRRLLAADTGDAPFHDSGRGLLIVTMVIVPLAACGLYLVHGTPVPPPVVTQAAMTPDRLVDTLRAKLAAMDPATPQAAKGWTLLGRIDAQRRDMAGAAAAWKMALKAGFDPFLAVAAAEADSEAVGRVTAEDAALFRQALQAAPHAPFRPMIEKRLQSIGVAP